MKAIVFNATPLGWLTCKWLKQFQPGCLAGPLNGFHFKKAQPIPELPTKHWVRVRTLLGGICGSDVAIVQQKPPPDSLLQAYTSQPFIPGHENVSVVEEVGPAVDASWLGRRVLVEPTLGCTARETEPPCERCEAGEFGACENFSGDLGGEAQLPEGTSIGYCKGTGGSWGEYFVAHESQLVPVDDAISNIQAVLVDPLACSAHAVLRADLRPVRSVLIYGGGMLGLGVVGCLRAAGFAGRIEVLDRSGYLADVAVHQGANDFFLLPDETKDRFKQVAGRTGATLQRARFGNYLISGGYDLVFDCVGSTQSLEESLKWTRARGQTVLLGTLPKGTLDLTALWFRELTVIGAYGRQIETWQGRRVGTYQLVLEWLKEHKLRVDGLLTHRFKIEEYHKALMTAANKSAHQAIKVAFDFR